MGRGRLSVELRIDKLVLHGFDPADRAAIGHAVETELGRLLSEDSLPASLTGLAEIERIDGGPIHVDAGAKPTSIGRRIAQAVYRVIGG
jgi:hypothetical protein